MQKKLVAAILATSLLGLAACDKAKEITKQAQTNLSTSAHKNPETSPEQAINNKINRYTQLSNELLPLYRGDTASMEENRIKMVAQAKAGDFKAISNQLFQFKQAQEQFEKILAMPGTIPNVDDAATTYLAVLNEYLPNWQELKKYNAAKKYEDDGGAKGKELLVKYNEGQDKLLAAQNTFEPAFKVALDQEKIRRMAEFKAKGQLLELHTNQALDKAGQMLELFKQPSDFQNQEKIKQANALLAQLDIELDAMDKERQKRKAADAGKTDSYQDKVWDGIHSCLVAFTGAYRETRKDPMRYNKMLSEHNDAVKSYNRM